MPAPVTIAQLMAQLDQHGMGAAIRACPDHIRMILRKYSRWQPGEPRFEPTQIVVLGMGGSAIGGDVVRVWVEEQASIPMTVSRNYQIPPWIGAGSLVLALSYSGDTEETLAAVKLASTAGARLTALTTGGRLGAMAEQHRWDTLILPPGLQPRAAIGYSIAAIVIVLAAYGIFSPEMLSRLQTAADIMEEDGRIWADSETPANSALDISRAIRKKQTVIYGMVNTTEAVALRFRSQLAENSKQLASHHLLPELSHNEIVALNKIKDKNEISVIWLADADDHPRIELRRKMIRRILGTHPGEVVLTGRGETLMERNLSLLHQMDWISYYTALLNGFDPSDVAILVHLKKEMSRV